MRKKIIRNVSLWVMLLSTIIPTYNSNPLTPKDVDLALRATIYALISDPSQIALLKERSNNIQLKTSFKVDADWGVGYQITVTVKNPSSTSTTSWSASFNLDNSNETITSFWNGNYTRQEASIKVTNPSWIGGGVIPAGGSVTFGFVVNNTKEGTRTLENLTATGTTQNPGPEPVPAPTAPTLDAIPQGSVNYTVSWNSVANATLYILQQSTSNTFSKPTTVYQGPSTSKSFTNQPKGTYYYRVRASNSTGYSPFSRVRSVTVNTTPVPVVPTTPTLNAIPQGSANYTVSWNSVANATSYTLQQSTSSSFSNSTTVYQGSSTSKSITNQPNGTYYYRVRASNSVGNSSFSNVRSVTVNNTPVPVPPAAPTLNAISPGSSQANYTVSWNSVANAISYTLQQSTTSNFSNLPTVYQGSSTSKAFTNQSNGTYYYRVRASNSVGNSAFSNVQSITVNNTPVPPSGSVIVEGYWESWNSNDPISSIVAMKTDVIDVSFVTFNRTGGSTFAVVGLDASLSTLTQFVTAAHAAGKKVKIAVGGATYPQTSLLQSTQDAQGLAQAISQFVRQYSLDGVDFDIEDYPPANLQIALIQNTRQQLGSNAIISYTPKTPTSTTAPYTQVVTGAHQYLDYISLMAYGAYTGYNYQDDVQALIKLGVPASKIVVGFMPGMDDIGIHTSLNMIREACQYILTHGLHGIMFWSLNRDFENVTGLGASAATNTAWSILHP